MHSIERYAIFLHTFAKAGASFVFPKKTKDAPADTLKQLGAVELNCVSAFAVAKYEVPDEEVETFILSWFAKAADRINKARQEKKPKKRVDEGQRRELQKKVDEEQEDGD